MLGGTAGTRNRLDQPLHEPFIVAGRACSEGVGGFNAPPDHGNSGVFHGQK